MIAALGCTLLVLILVWGVFSTLVMYEEAQGRRLVLAGARAKLDTGVRFVAISFATFLRYVDRHVIRLSWYYSLHSLLQAALRVVVSLYDYLEQRFHLNRERARALRAERRKERRLAGTGHLHSMAAHKEQVALSEAQKRKLRTKKLERE